MRGILVCAFGVLAIGCGDNLEPPPVERFLATEAPVQVRAGDAIAVTCLLTEGDVTRAVDAELLVTPDESVQRVGGAVIAAIAGTVEVACSLPELDVTDTSPARVDIIPGPAAEVVTEVTPNPLTAGDTLTATCTVYDAYGNLIEDSEEPTLGLTPTDPGNTVTGLEAEMTHAGVFNAACQVPGADSAGVDVEVMPGLPYAIVLGQDPATTIHPVDEIIEITHVVSDLYGNEVPDAVVTKTSMPVTGAGPTDVLGPSTFQYHGEGRYRVEGVVEAPTEGDLEVSATIDVVVDESGPRILCGSPGDASMVDVVPGTTVTFQGVATDVSGGVEATVNGVPVTVEDGVFSAPIVTRFGMNFVEIAASDDNNLDSTRICVFLVASEWATSGSSLAGGLMLKLRQAAWDDDVRSGPIDDFDDILSRVLNSQGMRDTVHDALLDANPLKPSSCDQQICVPFVGCTCVLRSQVTYIRSEFNGPNTSALTLVSGGVKVETRLENIRVRLNVKGHVAGIPYDSNGWVNIRSVDVDLILDTALSGGLPNVTVRSGSVVVTVGSISTDFSGIDGAVIDVVAAVANDEVKKIVSNAIRGFVVNNFNSVLDGLMSNLDVENLAASFDVPRIGGGTIPVSFGLGFSSLGTTTERMLIGIATRFTAPVANNFATLGAAIPPGTVAVDPTGSTPAAVAAHVALFNQLMHALWRANMFDVTIDISALDPDLPDDVSAIIVTRLPPVAVIQGDDVILHLGGIEAEVSHPDLPAGLVVALGATARTSVVLSPSGDLSFGSITIEELYFSSSQLEIGPTTLQSLEELALPFLQQFVDTSLNDALPTLPLPTFTLPASLATYGLPAGAELGLTSPTLTVAPQHFTLRGGFGIQ